MFLKLDDQGFIRPGILSVRPKVLQKQTSAVRAQVSKGIKSIFCIPLSIAEVGGQHIDMK